MLSPGTKILSYSIISQIGEGGMGSVFLAEHVSLGRKAAIKMLLPELARNRQIRERFVNEAKTLSLLNHQNIVTLYDYTEIDGNLFLVMEYVEGTNLDVIIERLGSVHEARSVNIFEQVLSGFAYAHKKGIIHRDIKPSNIVIQSDDTPKILDFGIAKIIEGDLKLTQTGTRMGSVVYMSPEQVLGKPVDRRSDIYSLGVTLFEMLAGRLPYNTQTESEFDIQTKIVKEPLPPARSLNPTVPEILENVIMRATEKEPGNRFNDCESFAAALRQTAGGYTAQKTVIQPPVQQNKTVFQTPSNVIAQTPKSSNKNLFILIGSAVIIAVLVLVYILTQNDNNGIEKIVTKDSQKEDKISAGSNNTADSKVNLIGFYEGTIKDGTRWIVKINSMNGSSISGYNTVYWQSKGASGLSSDFSGTYNSETGEIIMYEAQGKGSGKFTGTVYNNGAKMDGHWERYSDGGTFNWNLSKSTERNTNNDTPGRFPEASTRYLTDSDVSNLSSWDLKIMRNEIFARHGYIFKTDDMWRHFNAQSWYTGSYDNVDRFLTDIEKANIKLIQKYEK